MSKRERYDLPANLTFDKPSGRFRFRNPRTGKKTWVGKSEKREAELAVLANRELATQKLREHWSAKRQKEQKHRHELYRFFDSTGHLLYVGISLSLVRRMAQHRVNSHWYDQATTVTIERFETRLELESAERKAIRAESPIHNNALNEASDP